MFQPENEGPQYHPCYHHATEARSAVTAAAGDGGVAAPLDERWSQRGPSRLFFRNIYIYTCMFLWNSGERANYPPKIASIQNL